MSQLKPSLNFPLLVFYGTGMILGAGIYSIIGKAVVHTGETLWLGFALASLAAVLTALSYAELSSLFPKAGAEFIYLRHAFPGQKWLASTVGASMAFSGTATAATVAMAFSGYLEQFYEIPEFVIAVAVLVTLSVVALIGLKASNGFTVLSTLIEVSGLVLVIYLGFQSPRFGDVLFESPHHGTFSGAALIIFSFFGFENIVNLAEETRNPEKNLPRSILVSLVITTILYIFVSFSVLALVDVKVLSESPAPLMSAVLSISKNAATGLGIIALFSTTNTTLISLISSSRILYGMGEKKVLPQALAKVLPHQKTPWVASLVVLIISISLLPLGRLELIASISSLSTLFAFFFVNLGVIILRYNDPQRSRPFQVPVSIGRFPLLPFFGALITLGLMTQFEKTVYFISGTFFLAVALGFLWFHRRKDNL